MFKRLLLLAAVAFAAPVFAMEKKQVTFQEKQQPTSPVVLLRSAMPEAHKIGKITLFDDGIVTMLDKHDNPLAVTPLTKNFKSSEHKSKVIGLIAKFEQIQLASENFITTQGVTPVKSYVSSEQMSAVVVSPNSFEKIKNNDQATNRREAGEFVEVIVGSSDDEIAVGLFPAKALKNIKKQ